jgi:hypothetical protein
VSRTLRLLRAPVTSGPTYRRFVHLLPGAVLYLGLVALFVAAVNAGDLRPLDLLLLLVPATAMAVGWRWFRAFAPWRSPPPGRCSVPSCPIRSWNARLAR